jgi:hypothetical protein
MALSNRNPLKYVAIIMILIICGFVIYMGYLIYRSAEEAAVGSCISSIERILAEKLTDEGSAINPSGQWKILSQEEKEFLFDSIKDSKYFDCYRFPFYEKGKTRDKQDVQVSIRQIDSRMNDNKKIYDVHIGVGSYCAHNSP